MEDYQSTIRAFQRTLENHTFGAASSFSEDFAIKRFRKKFMRPESGVEKKLKQACWSDWISFDASLPILQNRTLSGEWYVARQKLHSLGNPQPLGSFRFPKGSEYVPTLGHNSIEARLASSKWTCTYDNFDLFCRIVRGNHALTYAMRRRYSRWFQRSNFSESQQACDKLLFNHFRHYSDFAYRIFCWKLERITTFTQGSRFASVPKNNLVRRPINVEPFGNTLTQSWLGEFFREQLLVLHKEDLETLQFKQRFKISNLSLATLDLKNASDSISMDLVRFLLPKRIVNLVEKARSPMIYGPDRSFHLVNKVSSMGNGFTFELMTLILTSIGRVLDPTCTVFGDDIIIDSTKASRLIELLTEVGFVVNLQKSFTSGPFRESCGANYHEVEGYIESYDYEFPETIGDCVTLWNKTWRLAKLYPQFAALLRRLYRILPVALHGGPDYQFDSMKLFELLRIRYDQRALNFPIKFVTKKCPPSAKVVGLPSGYLLPEGRLVQGFEFKPKLRSPCWRDLKHTNWAKYLMYLSAGRVCKDTITGEGVWRRVWLITCESRTFRASALKQVSS